MFPSKILLSLILVSLAAVEAGPVSRSTGKAALSFATRINASGTLSVVERDRARAQALKNPGHLERRSTTFSITNAVVTYTTQVGVGSPATVCMWIIRRPRYMG